MSENAACVAAREKATAAADAVVFELMAAGVSAAIPPPLPPLGLDNTGGGEKIAASSDLMQCPRDRSEHASASRTI